MLGRDVGSIWFGSNVEYGRRFSKGQHVFLQISQRYCDSSPPTMLRHLHRGVLTADPKNVLQLDLESSVLWRPHLLR